MNILLCNGKGGTGKTTLSVLLAHALAEAGRRVALRPHLPSGARLRLLFNGVQANTVLARDLPDLAARIGVESLRTFITRRQCYQHAALLGWQALDAAAREELFKAALEVVTA